MHTSLLIYSMPSAEPPSGHKAPTFSPSSLSQLQHTPEDVQDHVWSRILAFALYLDGPIYAEDASSVIKNWRRTLLFVSKRFYVSFECTCRGARQVALNHLNRDSLCPTFILIPSSLPGMPCGGSLRDSSAISPLDCTSGLCSFGSTLTIYARKMANLQTPKSRPFWISFPELLELLESMVQSSGRTSLAFGWTFSVSPGSAGKHFVSWQIQRVTHSLNLKMLKYLRQGKYARHAHSIPSPHFSRSFGTVAQNST
jgi:hypothetical protein